MSDIYFKKTIDYPYKGIMFQFDIAETLFSTFNIDHGTDILIRAIEPKNPKTILDVGCGYGPLGIILAKTNPKAKVIMLDSNLLAIRYSKINCQKNGIDNAEVLGSVGTENISEKNFDLIVSNIPAKIGDKAIAEEFIIKPYKLLNREGEYWIVVVSALNRLIPKVCAENNIKVSKIRKRSGHTVYKITK